MMSVCTGCGGKKPMRLVQCKACEAAEIASRPSPIMRKSGKRFAYMDVYCVTSGALGSTCIKFGISGFVENRIADMQTGSPVELRIVGSVNARPMLESRILSHLDAYNCWGEWFEPHDQVLAIARRFERREWRELIADLWEKPTFDILRPSEEFRINYR